MNTLDTIRAWKDADYRASLSAAELAALPALAARLPGLGHVAASYLYRGDDVARINRLERAARASGLILAKT